MDHLAAYCAGLFDGEGSAGIHRQAEDNTYHLTLRLRMTHREGVYRFREKVGYGTIREQQPPGIRVPSWLWFVGRREEVGRILLFMLPHLVVKAEEARIGLTFLRTKDKREQRRLWIAMRCLKTKPGPRGWSPAWRRAFARQQERA